MNFFWVNQSDIDKELDLEAIVSDTQGQTNHARLRIFEVKKGDIIFSFSKNGLQAVLIAKKDADKNASRCVVSCSYTIFEFPFSLEQVIHIVGDNLKEKYSPVNIKGNRNQGYLYPLNNVAGNALLKLCGLDFDAGNELIVETKPAPRKDSVISRIIRDTKKSNNVKNLYNNSCQVCGVRLLTSEGPYSEGAHIIPLGAPHDGPDEESNILCLCPNHHVLLDGFSFTISEAGGLIGM